tara:strand:+ start:353 stop:673 length:321 start_codon:yes stop_codon:yes gene_type:complete
MDLNSNDYKKIIKYYNIQNNEKKTNKELAEDVLANKLCRCIKKVNTSKINEKAAIAICRNHIFKNRKIDFYNFKCKKSRKLISKKGTKKKLKKFSKKIRFNKTKKN